MSGFREYSTYIPGNPCMPEPLLAITINGQRTLPLVEWMCEETLANRVFHSVIWLAVPAPELRALVLKRMAMFPEGDRREMWVCARPAEIL